MTNFGLLELAVFLVGVAILMVVVAGAVVLVRHGVAWVTARMHRG